MILFISNESDAAKNLEPLLAQKFPLTRCSHGAPQLSGVTASAYIASNEQLDRIVEFVGLPEVMSEVFKNTGNHFSPKWVQGLRSGIPHLLITSEFIEPNQIKYDDVPNFQIVSGEANPSAILKLLQVMLN
jgi:hypothetical protein